MTTVKITDIKTEIDLILSKAGIFNHDTDDLQLYTICPRHRFLLGGGWYSRSVCNYPSHTGKEKPDRSINKQDSKLIMLQLGEFVVVGSGKGPIIIYGRGGGGEGNFFFPKLLKLKAPLTLYHHIPVA
jgi:hypothetical protein